MEWKKESRGKKLFFGFHCIYIIMSVIIIMMYSD